MRPPSLLAPRRPVTTAAAKTAANTALRTPRAAPVSTDNVDEQRVYHVTHINNLAAILSAGRLLADASDEWGTRPTVDISTTDTRESRRAAQIDGQSRTVAHYVPFFLSPNASIWESIRTRDTDPRLDIDAHGSEAFDFVILVSTVKKVNDAITAVDEQAAGAADDAASVTAAQIAVTNGDAAAASTRFGATVATAERMLQTLRAEADGELILEAELLVPDAFPFELVTLVGVSNDNVREAVRGILKASAFKPKVVVYPPWFHSSAESD